jgi:hypothetical protein
VERLLWSAALLSSVYFAATRCCVPRLRGDEPANAAGIEEALKTPMKGEELTNKRMNE